MDCTDILDASTRKLRRRRARDRARRERAYFRARAEANREHRRRRDGSAGPAGPCKRIDAVTGVLVGIEPVSDG
jgi:hypothetical protein